MHKTFLVILKYCVLQWNSIFHGDLQDFVQHKYCYDNGINFFFVQFFLLHILYLSNKVLEKLFHTQHLYGTLTGSTFALYFSRSISSFELNSLMLFNMERVCGINRSLCMDFNGLKNSIWDGNLKSLWELYKSVTLKNIFCLLPMLRISNQWSLLVHITILIRFLL